MNQPIAEPTLQPDLQDKLQDLKFETIQALRETLNSAIKGKKEVIEHLIVGIFSGGHILFDDQPGLGKTTLGKAIAAAIGGSFGRLQGTPDLLPSDVTGFNVFNRKTQDFAFRPGPVFSDVLLVDEINRATPRTQSSLFEAMGERQVTIDGKSYTLPQTFFVIATQNPTDHQGTYQLPEAQLDRFAMVLRIGFPDEESEIEVLKEKASQGFIDSGETNPVMTPNELALWQQKVSGVFVAEKIQRYLVQIAKKFRNNPQLRTGLSPRGLISLQRSAQSHAMINERDFVTPDDVQAIALPVLGVRIPGSFEESQKTVDDLLKSVPCPSE